MVPKIPTADYKVPQMFTIYINKHGLAFEIIITELLFIIPELLRVINKMGALNKSLI